MKYCAAFLSAAIVTAGSKAIERRAHIDEWASFELARDPWKSRMTLEKEPIPCNLRSEYALKRTLTIS